jgi:hypothetical protein
MRPTITMPRTLRTLNPIRWIHLVYTFIAGALGIGSWWINGLVFQNLEVSSGINLIYWPHGIRVLTVLLFGFPGAVGLTLSGFIVSPSIYAGQIWMASLAPLVSGLAPYAARRMILLERTRELPHLERLSPKTLISLVTLSALFNAGGHTLLRIASGFGENHPAEFCAMLAGDLLGALTLLFGLSLVLLAWGKVMRSGRKAKPESWTTNDE